MKIKYCILFLGIFIIGCYSKTTSVDAFYRKLDHTLSDSEKSKIIGCPDVGCLVKLVPSELRKKFKDAYDPEAVDINKFLIDSFKISNLYDRERILFLGYQKKLMGRPIDYVKIRDEITQFDKLEARLDEDEQMRYIANNMGIARSNFIRFKIGDTLQLELPLEKQNNRKSVYYYSYYNKKNFYDTLFLKCILLKKAKQVAQPIKFNHDEYFFLVKIIDLNNSEADLVEERYQKGMSMFIPLYAYGRVLNKRW